MNRVTNQIQVLERLQNKGNGYYPDGFFASQRRWLKGLYQRHDNTAFFTASIGFVLMRIIPLLREEEKMQVQGIIENMKPAFGLYRNKDGHPSYNFWETKRGKQFPGGYVAHHFDFFLIPDDIDDSALIHLVKQHSEQEQLELKRKMMQFAIGTLKWPDMPVPGYELAQPYNTFFVKNMPAAFDVCALSNILYFSYYYKLPLHYNDLQSLALIEQCVAHKDYLTRPYYMSPYYPNSVLIIYHLVRLLCDFEIAELQKHKNQFIEDCTTLISEPLVSAMDKLILSITLMRLCNKPVECSKPSTHEMNAYTFFVAGLLGEVKPKLLRKYGYLPATQLKYKCIAYAESLWLEYLVLFGLQR